MSRLWSSLVSGSFLSSRQNSFYFFLVIFFFKTVLASVESLLLLVNLIIFQDDIIAKIPVLKKFLFKICLSLSFLMSFFRISQSAF